MLIIYQKSTGKILNYVRAIKPILHKYKKNKGIPENDIGVKAIEDKIFMDDMMKNDIKDVPEKDCKDYVKPVLMDNGGIIN